MAKKHDNIKDLKKDELVKKLAELRENLRVISFKMEGAKTKNVREIRAIKKNIARVLTETNKNNNKSKKNK